MISRSLGPEAGSAIGKFSNLNLNLQSNMTNCVCFSKQSGTITYFSMCVLNSLNLVGAAEVGNTIIYLTR